MQIYNNVTIEVTGHTNTLSTDGYVSTNTEVPENQRQGNLGLSWDRALSVKKFLTTFANEQNFSINADRITVDGKGDSNLVDSDNPTGDINRRIEIDLSIEQ